MFQRLLEMIRNAIASMVAYRSITEAINTDGEAVSAKMTEAMDLWQRIYENRAPWLKAEEGITSTAKAKKACKAMTATVLKEFKLYTIPPDYDIESGDDIDENSRAFYINDILDKHLKDRLKEKIEQAFAMGGCIIKPYISNGSIYFDFISQGDFMPIAFDDDGNITDIAFIDRFVSGNRIFTRVERHTFANKKIIIENQAFETNYNANTEKEQKLGNRIPLNLVSK